MHATAALVDRRRDWIFITRPENWSICSERQAFGFDPPYRPTLSRYMHAGDRALVYVTSPVKGIAVAVTVTRVQLGETEPFGWTERNGGPKLYPDRVYWKPLRRFDPPLRLRSVPELFERVQFIPDKGTSRYMSYLFGALVRVADEDVDLVLSWR